MNHAISPLITAMRIAALSAFSLGSFALADTIIMKATPGGEAKKYERAKVLTETPTSVTFEYNPVGNIKDTRTEQKTDIAEIIRQKPEEVEIVPLREVAKVPDLSTSDKYETIVQEQLRPFINKYPGTPQAAEVEELIKGLQAEKEKIISGSVKMDGQWLTPEQAKRDAREIEAYKVRRVLREALAKGQYREALNQWDVLKEREDGYMDTLQIIAAVDEAKDALAKYRFILDNMLREQPMLKQRRETTLKSLVEPDLTRAKRAFEEEDRKFKAQSDLEKRTRQQWKSTYKYDLKSIEDALKSVATEEANISLMNIDKLREQNEALTVARRYIADGNLDEAEKQIVKAQAAKAKDGTTAIQKVRAEAATLRTEINKKKTTQRLYGGGTSTPSATSFGKGQDERAAAAMAAAEKSTTEPAAKVEDKPAAKPGIAVSSMDTARKNGVDVPKDDDDLASKPAKRKPVAVPDDSALQKYLLIGGVALLVVLLLAVALQKKKRS